MDVLTVAAALWRGWLGEPDTRPPPLDRYLSGALRDRPAKERTVEVVRAVEATAAFAAPSLAWIAGVPPRRLPTRAPDLVDALRRVPARRLVACAGVLSQQPWARDDGVLAQVEAWSRGDEVARCVAAGVPPGWVPLLSPRFAVWGEERTARWLIMQGRRPPLWVRAQQPDAVARLQADGLRVEVVDGALRVEGGVALRATSAWRDGLIEAQDLASQRVGRQVGVVSRQVVWDVCAGSGGKTLQLASDLQGRGAVHATDIDARKLDTLRRRVRRAGLADVVRVHPWDGTSVLDTVPEVARRGGFDAVLVDAPCSATGTWRRNPDARLRHAPDPGHWAPAQRALVLAGASAVRPGGTLVYATCSVLLEENEAVAAEVEARLVGFDRVDEQLFGAPDENADTLYAATWRRRAV